MLKRNIIQVVLRYIIKERFVVFFYVRLNLLQFVNQ